ncbi:coiled-coil domain-containing protein 14 isoform X2 [Eleutherodactylus coqui]
MPFTKGNVRSSTVKAKKTVVRKPTTAAHVYKEKGPLRRTLPPGLCNAAIQKPRASSPPLIVPSRNLDHVTTQMQCLNHVSGPVTYSAPSAPGPEASALYNCRLPTSTPTLSPQHPANSQSSRNQDFHQTLPPGGITHFPSSMSATSAFSMAGNIQASVPTGYQVTQQANILSQLDNYKSLIQDSDLLQCVAAHLAQLQQTETPLQNQAASHIAKSDCEQEGPPTESDEASASEDDAPSLQHVREISCQTSFSKHNKSPEKTERKIKTVKYLLGEIKSLVTHQGDREAMRLVTELEHSVALLPVVAGSTNIHAEIALALQPLRSENAQLRRRLRILNQQLRERERVGRSDEQNSEVTALQSMNETLQHQLSELQKGLKALQSKNEELQKVIEVQKEEESRKAIQIGQEREQEILHIKQQNDITSGSMKKDMEEAVGKMKSVQFKLEASEKENQILGITLRQRDAEVTRLRELTRTLQASMAKLLCDLGKDSPKPKRSSSLTQAALGSYDKQAQSEQCPANNSIMNYLKRLETDQVFTGTDSIYSSNPLLAASGQVSCGKAVNAELSEDYGISKTHLPHNSPRKARPRELTYSPQKQELGSESCYIISEEHRPDETVYLPLASSPPKAKYDSSLRLMCTPPKVCSLERDTDASCPYLNPNGLSRSDKNLGVHIDSRYLCTSDMTSRVEGPPSTIPPQSYPPPVLQQMKSLQFRDDPPSERSLFEGKPDSTICSFSTFTSHDEQDFRNGLAALDANIAKLQRTLQNGGARK